MSGDTTGGVALANFRDVFEISGDNYRRGVLFRSTALGYASASDVDVILKILRIKTVVDLREDRSFHQDDKPRLIYDNYRLLPSLPHVPSSTKQHVLVAALAVAVLILGYFEHHVYVTSAAVATALAAWLLPSRLFLRPAVGKRAREALLTKRRPSATATATPPIHYVQTPFVDGHLQVTLAFMRTVGPMATLAALRHSRGFVRAVVDWVGQGGLDTLNLFMLNRSGAELAQALKLVADERNHPLVFHCLTGKDRTGLLSILIQLAVGVPREVIVRDYARSFELLQGSPAMERLRLDATKAKFPVDKWAATPPYVCERTLDHIEALGGIECYLDNIGFDATWRARLQQALVRDN